MTSPLVAKVYQESRRDMLSYVTRMTLRAEVAEEIVQQAALRLVEKDPAPGDADGTRAWLFRVATNLALDHLRRHATKREHIMLETRERAEADPAFLADVALLRGSAETSAIAREHLMICFACTLRNLPQAGRVSPVRGAGRAFRRPPGQPARRRARHRRAPRDPARAPGAHARPVPSLDAEDRERPVWKRIGKGEAMSETNPVHRFEVPAI